MSHLPANVACVGGLFTFASLRTLSLVLVVPLRKKCVQTFVPCCTPQSGSAVVLERALVFALAAHLDVRLEGPLEHGEHRLLHRVRVDVNFTFVLECADEELLLLVERLLLLRERRHLAANCLELRDAAQVRLEEDRGEVVHLDGLAILLDNLGVGLVHDFGELLRSYSGPEQPETMLQEDLSLGRILHVAEARLQLVQDVVQLVFIVSDFVDGPPGFGIGPQRDLDLGRRRGAPARPFFKLVLQLVDLGVVPLDLVPVGFDVVVVEVLFFERPKLRRRLDQSRHAYQQRRLFVFLALGDERRRRGRHRQVVRVAARLLSLVQQLSVSRRGEVLGELLAPFLERRLHAFPEGNVNLRSHLSLVGFPLPVESSRYTSRRKVS